MNRVLPLFRILFIVTGLVLFGLGSLRATQAQVGSPLGDSVSDQQIGNPNQDIPYDWFNAGSSVADIKAGFDHGRSEENNQLGTSVPPITMPSQAEWDGLSNGEKVLYLLNQERVARGLPPFHGLESNVQAVAEAYAQYLIDNNTTGHSADGKSPFERMEEKPAIAACNTGMAENLSYAWTIGSSISNMLALSVYNWMYDDSGSAWGHRQIILMGLTEDGGSNDREGFVGIGWAGGSYDPFNQGANYGEVVVMDLFDPCSTWNYGSDDPPTEFSHFVYLPAVLSSVDSDDPPDNSFADEVITEVNVQRAANGCAALVKNDLLTQAAQSHTEDMANQDFFSHTGLDGSQPWDRVSATGYQWSTVGENIAGGQSTPAGVMNAWMNSAGHRANILNCNFTEIGVGYYFLENDTGSENWNHYWTQVFARPR